MDDPEEGVGPDGAIVTGARRDRVPAAFESVVVAAADAVRAADRAATLYVYGSVATGRARVGRSDVDLLSVGLPGTVAAGIGAELSGRFAALCRGVEVGAAQPGDLVGDSDEAHGNRVFVRHYCALVSGPPLADPATSYPADTRAARGFNGDIAVHAQRWRRALDEGAPPATVARRLARKTLLAVASLVSVHDRTWTTDRDRAARRWAEIRPPCAADLAVLRDWTDLDPDSDPDLDAGPTRPRVRRALDGPVAAVVDAFARTIGLWPDRHAT